MKTYLAEPCGYCQGVQRALALAMNFKKANPNTKCYTLGAIVHNEKVISELNNLGIESLLENEPDNIKINKIPRGSSLIFSAHGHDKNLEDILNKKSITFLDTTCPMVELGKENILNAIKDDFEVIFIGKKNHPETNTMISLAKKIFLYDDIKDNLEMFKNKKVFVTTQTTYSSIDVDEIIDELKKKLSSLKFKNGICFETKARQESIFKLPKEVDCVFVVGGTNSSNTRRLYEIAKTYFTTLKIFHIRNEKEIDKKLILGCSSAAIIAGASTNRIDAIKVKHVLDDVW